MELIDKAAVVAEIERLIERAKAERVLHPKTILAAKNYLLIEDYNKLLSFLDTLEVKDVDEIIKTAEDHAYFAGSETMREKIMAKSVDAIVSQVPCINEIIFRSPHIVRKYSNIVTDMMELGLEKGDLVKLIVVKTQKGE